MKDNQKDLGEDIETAFREPVSPLAVWRDPPSVGHGRIESRDIAVLPAGGCRSTPVAAGRRFAISRVSDAGESTFAKDEL